MSLPVSEYHEGANGIGASVATQTMPAANALLIFNTVYFAPKQETTPSSRQM
jgi:hypothetical protein